MRDRGSSTGEAAKWRAQPQLQTCAPLSSMKRIMPSSPGSTSCGYTSGETTYGPPAGDLHAHVRLRDIAAPGRIDGHRRPIAPGGDIDQPMVEDRAGHHVSIIPRAAPQLFARRRIVGDYRFGIDDELLFPCHANEQRRGELDILLARRAPAHRSPVALSKAMMKLSPL